MLFVVCPFCNFVVVATICKASQVLPRALKPHPDSPSLYETVTLHSNGYMKEEREEMPPLREPDPTGEDLAERNLLF